MTELADPAKVREGAGDEGRDYLLIPPYPVPNGTLHAGHVAGPYLRLDMLARHLRRRGDRVRVIYGTDACDPYVALRAAREEVDPTALALANHGRIARDLEALDLDVDCLISPLATAWAERYAAAYVDLVNRLLTAGVAERIEESLPYSEARGEYVLGGRLGGRCPDCNAEAGAFVCEDCGAVYHPRSLRQPRSDRDGEELTWRTTSNLFFRAGDPQAVLDQLVETETPEPFREICIRNLRRHGPLLRLTAPGRWGLPWSFPDDDEPRVLVGQGLLLAYCNLCGEVYSELTGDPVHPFDQSSGVVTVNGFGIDNVITHMVGIQAAAMSLPGLRPFDRFLVNHFQLLGGEKFSTSRRHVIWAGDLVSRTPVASDALRYHLALTSPTKQRENFDVVHFLEVVNGLADRVNGPVTAALAKLADGPASPAGEVRGRLAEELERQETAFAFRSFEPAEAVASIDRWLAEPFSGWGEGACGWLEGLAILAEPVMPRLAEELWRSLGGSGRPTAATRSRQRPQEDAGFTRFETVGLSDLRPCLPPTLAIEDPRARV